MPGSTSTTAAMAQPAPGVSDSSAVSAAPRSAPVPTRTTCTRARCRETVRPRRSASASPDAGERQHRQAGRKRPRTAARNGAAAPPRASRIRPAAEDGGGTTTLGSSRGGSSLRHRHLRRCRRDSSRSRARHAATAHRPAHAALPLPYPPLLPRSWQGGRRHDRHLAHVPTTGGPAGYAQLSACCGVEAFPTPQQADSCVDPGSVQCGFRRRMVAVVAGASVVGWPRRTRSRSARRLRPRRPTRQRPTCSPSAAAIASARQRR